MESLTEDSWNFVILGNFVIESDSWWVVWSERIINQKRKGKISLHSSTPPLRHTWQGPLTWHPLGPGQDIIAIQYRWYITSRIIINHKPQYSGIAQTVTYIHTISSHYCYCIMFSELLPDELLPERLHFNLSISLSLYFYEIFSI